MLSAVVILLLVSVEAIDDRPFMNFVNSMPSVNKLSTELGNWLELRNKASAAHNLTGRIRNKQTGPQMIPVDRRNPAKTLSVGGSIDCDADEAWDAHSQECRRVSSHRSFPADVGCPLGCQPGSVIDLECECVEEAEPMFVCDAGFTRDIRKRIHPAGAPQKRTRNGGITNSFGNSEVCYRHETTKPASVCAPGSRFQDPICLRSVTDAATPVCPGDDWSLDESHSLCVSQEVMSAQAQCPEGFQLLAASKLRSLGSNKIKGNPQPLPLFSNPPIEIVTPYDLCVSLRSSPPVTRCPEDFRLDQGGEVCLRDVFVTPMTDCPVGFQPDPNLFGVCRKETVTVPAKVCPDGYHEVSRKARRLAASQNKPSSKSNKSNKSTKSKTPAPDPEEHRLAMSLMRQRALAVNPNVTLPDLSTDTEEIVDDSYDEMFEPIDLELEPIDLELEGMEMVAASSSVREEDDFEPVMEWSSETDTTLFEHEEPLQWGPKKVSKSQIEVTNLDDKLECEREIYEAAMPLCRDGFDFSVRENSTPGFWFDGRQCVMPERAGIHLECGPGDVLKGSTCVSTITTPGSPLCPPGKDYIYQPSVGRCVTIEDRMAIQDCPSGMALHSETNRCVDTTSVHSAPGCPVPFELDSTKKLCIRPLTQVPILSCPPDSQLVGASCQREVDESPTEVCPEGFAPDTDNLCHKEEVRDLKQTCSYGFVLYNEKCIRQYTLNGSYQCPAGSVHSANDESVCIVP